MSDNYLVLPDGSVTQAQDNAEYAYLVNKLGARAPTQAEVRKETMHQQYSDWLYSPLVAAGAGFMEGALPGAESAALVAGKAISPGAASTAQEAIQGSEAAAPWSHAAGVGAGFIVSPVGKALKAGSWALRGLQALQGGLMAADSLAVQHLNTPLGGETALATIGLSAVLGPVLGKAAELGANNLIPWLRQGAQDLAAKAITKGEENALGRIIPTQAQAGLEARGMLDDVKQFVMERDLLTKPSGAIRAEAKQTLGRASDVMDEAIRATRGRGLGMEPQDQITLHQTLRSTLQGTGAGRAVPSLTETSRRWTLGDLHKIRMNLDNAIPWKDINAGGEISAVTQQVLNARKMVSGAMDDMLNTLQGVSPELSQQADRWIQANKDFSASSTLLNLVKGRSQGGSSVMATIARSVGGAAGAAAGHAVGGFPGAFVGGAAGSAAAGKAMQNMATANPLMGIGEAIKAFDGKVVNTIVNGLGRAGVTAATTSATFTKLGDYDTLTNVIRAGAAQPAGMVPHVAMHLDEQGVPGELVDAALPASVGAFQWLATQVPQNPFPTGTTVAPVVWQPSVREKRAFLEKIETVANPLAALENPTPAKVNALRAVYPMMAQKITQAILQAAADQPGMAAPARRWAALLTGVPASPMASPQSLNGMVFAEQLLKQQRAMAQQQSQQSSAGNNPMVQMGDTRLDRMSS